MEQVTQTAGSICIIVMLLGLLSRLGSFSATEKIIRFVTVLYIVTAFLTSFRTCETDFNMSQYTSAQNYSENSDILKDEIIKKTKTELEQLVAVRLNEKNISYKLLSLHILEQNGSITVDEIMVICSSQHKDTVIECIDDIVSEETKIYIGE